MPANIKQDNRYNPKAKFSIQPAGTSGEVHGHKWQVWSMATICKVWELPCAPPPYHSAAYATSTI